MFPLFFVATFVIYENDMLLYSIFLAYIFFLFSFSAFPLFLPFGLWFFFFWFCLILGYHLFCCFSVPICTSSSSLSIHGMKM